MVACTAPPPFQHAKADIIRSSDNVDFRVFTLFLNLASSSFDTIIEQGRQSNQIEDNLPIVLVEENNKVLDMWLRFCYPSSLAEDPVLDDFEDILPILEAARKYSLKGLEDKVREALKSRMEKEPLRCFALAMRGQLTTEATLAATYTLREPLIPARFPEINLITAAELLMLLTYHRKCGVLVQSLGKYLSWITRSGSYEWIISGSCNCESDSRFSLRVNGRQTRPLKWWCDYMESTLASLFDKPSGHTVHAGLSTVVRDVRGAGCPRCCSDILRNMTAFTQLFSMEVDIWTEKVDMLMGNIDHLLTEIQANPEIPNENVGSSKGPPLNMKGDGQKNSKAPSKGKKNSKAAMKGKNLK